MIHEGENMLTSTLHHFVNFALYVELRMFGFDTFQFDGNLFSSSYVSTLKKNNSTL